MMAMMDRTHSNDDYLTRLRRWRNRPDPDLSMGFLQKQFKQQIEKPFKQLGAIAMLWESLVPKVLAQHTKVDSLQRGVLQISVDSSARLYELDRLMRSGLEQRLIIGHKGPALRKVRLRVAPIG
jgi:predicted nucleic acid-binding Zn ribbon protein